MTADNIQNMSFSTLKRKLFDEEEEKAMSYAQTEAESPIKIHYAEVNVYRIFNFIVYLFF